ncbi:STAS domain-containing protein [Dactylosporangium sp. CS-033363]|uniref:STAS domain-containing protein n=1 Tax=Dactylosporangium sp. CS-033363 TaxID=3239935 RepID=UPI003D8BEDC6
MLDEFAVRIDHRAEEAAVAVSGLVDLDSGNRLFDALADVLGRPGTRRVTVDLAEVTLLDAYGVGVLLAGRNRARTAGVRFRVTNAEGIVREVLQIVGLLDVLTNRPAP